MYNGGLLDHKGAFFQLHFAAMESLFVPIMSLASLIKKLKGFRQPVSVDCFFLGFILCAVHLKNSSNVASSTEVDIWPDRVIICSMW